MGTKPGKLTADLINIWTEDVQMNRYFIVKVTNEAPTSTLGTPAYPAFQSSNSHNDDPVNPEV